MTRLRTVPQRLANAGARLGANQSAVRERLRGSSWMAIRDRIMRRDSGVCQECRRSGHYRAGHQVDHIVPLAEGGSDDDSNLEVICDEHHEAKSQRESKRRAGGA